MPQIFEQTASDDKHSGATALESLDREKICSYLDGLGVSNINHIHVFSKIASTNDFLLEQELGKQCIAICVADQQTCGRGRYGHKWQSPGGVNLYLSMTWPIKEDKQSCELLCLWLLIALANLLKKNGCVDVQLKWPNDICVANKKLAGVLIERKIGKGQVNLVIGLGLNIAMSLKRDVTIDTPWIDLLKVAPKWSKSRNQLAAEIVHEFNDVLCRFDNNDLGCLPSIWKQFDMLQNKRVNFMFRDELTVGKVLGLNDNGEIIINVEGSAHHFNSAHISKIRIMDTR